MTVLKGVSEIVVKYKKIDNSFIAQCQQYPQFSIRATKKSKIKVNMKNMIEDWICLFPKEREKILLGGNNFRIILSEWS